ncbi:DinB family protein, partial [bacterium BMS3Abin03]|nr:DinB family protein [bacterium BMS3Abin03]
CKNRITDLTDEAAHRHFVFGSIDLNIMELLLYNMRHVQHHTAQLNLLLRQKMDSAPRWVKQTGSKLEND